MFRSLPFLGWELIHLLTSKASISPETAFCGFYGGVNNVITEREK